MNQQLASDFTRFNESALQSFSELGALSFKMFERLGEVQLGLMSQLLDVGTQQFKAFTESKGYQELISVESDLLSQYNQFLLDNAKTVTDIVAESKQELTQIVEKGLDPVTPEAAAPKKPTTRRKANA